jgi:hypothetical protein
METRSPILIIDNNALGANKVLGELHVNFQYGFTVVSYLYYHLDNSR